MPRTLLFLFLFLFSQLTMAFSYTLTISEKEIQDKVSAMMPVEKKKMLATIIVSDAKVGLIPQSDEVGVSTKIRVLVPGNMEGTGQVKIRGSLSYSANEGAFYLGSPVVDSLDIEQVPEKFHPQLQQLSQKALGQVLARYPVYKFKDDDLKHKMAKAVLKSVAVKDQKLLVTLSAF